MAVPIFSKVLFTVFTAQVTVGHVVGAALFAASYGYSSIQQRKLKKRLASMREFGTTVTSREVAGNRTFLYGERVVGGNLVFFHTTGTSNKYLHLVVALTDHFPDEIDDIRLDGTWLGMPWGSGEWPAPGNFFDGKVRVKKHRGEVHTADSDLVSESGGYWTADHIGTNVAYIYIRLEWDQEKFPSGMPQISVRMKGKWAFDPRDSSNGYTRNPALQLLDYLTDTTIGKGLSLGRIDVPSFIAGANVCDEQVELADSSFQDRYRCDYFSDTGVSHDDHINVICRTMAASLIESGGKYYLRVGAYATPTVSLGPDDIVDVVQLQTEDGIDLACNRVRGLYSGPLTDYEPDEFPPVVNALYLSEDHGIERWRDIELIGVTDPVQAQRLAKIELELSRQDMQYKIRTNLAGLQLRAGNNFLFTFPKHGVSNKPFRVEKWELDLQVSDDGHCTVGTVIYAREIASTCYDWDKGEETTVDPAPNTNLPDGKHTEPATGLTLYSGTSELVMGMDGTIVSRILVEWTPPVDEYVISGGWYVIEWKKSADSDWNSTQVDGRLSSYYISPVEDGEDYDVRIKAYNARNNPQDTWETVTNHTVLGKTAPPTNVTNGSAVGVGGGIIISCDAPSDPDFAGVAIYESSTTTKPSNPTLYVAGSPNQHIQFFRGNLGPSQTRYYWLQAVDTSGNGATTTIGPFGATTASGGTGTDGYTFRTDSLVHVVACDSAGTPHIGQLGPSGNAQTAFEIWKGGTPLVAVNTSPTAGEFRITITAQSGMTLVKPSTNYVYVNTLSVDVATATIEVEYDSQPNPVTYTMTVIKAKDGPDGSPAPGLEIRSNGTAFVRDPNTSTWNPGSIILECIVSNITSPTYQWQYWTGSAWTNVAAATSSTLSVSNSAFSTSTRTYRCLVNGTYWEEKTLARIENGDNAYNTLISNAFYGIACDDAGVPHSGQLGVSGTARAIVFAARRNVELTPTASVPTTGQYRATLSSQVGGSFVVSGNTVYCTAMSADIASVQVVVNCENLVAFAHKYELSKIYDGSPGSPGAPGSPGSPGAPGADGAGYGGTSTSSILIGTGSKSLTTQTGLAYVVGSRIRLTNSATNWMEGQVTAYNPSTGAMTVNVLLKGGSGTFASWTLSLAGLQGTGIPYVGGYVGSTAYIHDAFRRDVVSHLGVFYVANNPAKNTLTTWGTPGSSPDWESMGTTYKAVATALLLAEDATILRTLVMGDGSANAGIIRSWGATTFSAGTGYWIGTDGTVPKVRFGDPSNSLFSWDPTNGVLLQNGKIEIASTAWSSPAAIKMQSDLLDMGPIRFDQAGTGFIRSCAFRAQRQTLLGNNTNRLEILGQSDTLNAGPAEDVRVQFQTWSGSAWVNNTVFTRRALNLQNGANSYAEAYWQQGTAFATRGIPLIVKNAANTDQFYANPTNGELYTVGAHFISGDRVVGGRKTGWTAPTGTLSRATFNEATVTLPQLAQRVAALITDLHFQASGNHGLIGN